MTDTQPLTVVGCIPARYASSRLPGKPLCDIAGRPMILHVLERASRCKTLSDIYVLTDDQRIFDVVTSSGYKAIMTSEHCSSGTDRIAEFMQQSEASVFVNIQGDEVMLDPAHVDQLVTKFSAQERPQMGTLAHWCDDRRRLAAPSNVKVVTAINGDALYFSRNMIPVNQDGNITGRGKIHIGIYIYTRETLTRLMSLDQSTLEQIEKLEQLRALENNITINVTTLDGYQGLSVDTPEDLEATNRIFSKKTAPVI